MGCGAYEVKLFISSTVLLIVEVFAVEHIRLFVEYSVHKERSKSCWSLNAAVQAASW